MDRKKVWDILESNYDSNIADKVLESYSEIESNFFVQKWKPSELDAGHFVESIRRLIEFEINGGTYTLFSQKLSNFSDSVLSFYEQQTHIHESFRMLIPRILKSTYNIRNKRGVGHIKDISPNEMDATLILYSVKWILSEIVRLKSNLDIVDTQNLIDNIVERNVEVVWKTSDFTRILNNKISARNQVLIILYHSSKTHIDDLREIIEYKNASNFKTLIKKLHSERFLEFRANGNCILSPTGRIEAEKLILELKKST
ncbi:hypothetical protein KO506_06925 [Polaribacter vadi]|uniref:hypothetical protein n=1 Tax=Polaribacter TaxID=52959 RepID=UPI001C08C923|nr:MULTISPECIES: hypothetical protein [Polaribacter]MBU3011129.1 hypothetical protein [Polaribacter vadi]MDO6740943.1 hypothetical protein [Polaribacter sp. 1_MG-2023]